MKYNEMRADVLATREREVSNGFPGASAHTAWKIAGVSFGMRAMRQSYNGAHAVQVLHYVQGIKVSQKYFKDALSQVLPSSCCKEAA